MTNPSKITRATGNPARTAVDKIAFSRFSNLCRAWRRFAILAGVCLLATTPVVRAQVAPVRPVTPVAVETRREGILNTRLVRVSESAELGRLDPGLEDVMPLLRANLRYSDYRLIEDRDLKLRPGVEREFPGGFRVFVSDIDKLIMTVSVDRHQQSLLRTRLRLRVGRPLVVGPFRDPGGSGGFILIFTLKN